MQEVWLSPLPMREGATTTATVPGVRQRPVRVPRGGMPSLRSPPLRVHQKDKSEARRWERALHSAHGVNDLLAQRWDTNIRTAIYGAAVRETARFLQERGAATGTLERPRYEKEASEGTCGKGF